MRKFEETVHYISKLQSYLERRNVVLYLQVEGKSFFMTSGKAKAHMSFENRYLRL